MKLLNMEAYSQFKYQHKQWSSDHPIYEIVRLIPDRTYIDNEDKYDHRRVGYDGPIRKLQFEDNWRYSIK